MSPTATEHFLNEEDVYDEVAARGAERAVVSFSGGNDEGGVDRIALIDNSGELVAYVEPDLRPYEYVLDESGALIWEYADPPAGMKHPFYRPKTHHKHAEGVGEDRFSDALGAPVYAAYGSFAGEFFVAAELVWDAGLRRRYFTG